MACYFLLCLRVSYFDEYRWNADLKEVYATLASFNQTGVRRVEANGLYQASLEFYRRISTTEMFDELLVMGDEPRPGKDAYVLQVPYYQPFIDKEGLRVVYRSESTGVAVAIRGGLLGTR
ncbi:MAG: hypothetical protein ABI824_14775 [Acidobacteriota bacterium]